MMLTIFPPTGRYPSCSNFSTLSDPIVRTLLRPDALRVRHLAKINGVSGRVPNRIGDKISHCESFRASYIDRAVIMRTNGDLLSFLPKPPFRWL